MAAYRGELLPQTESQVDRLQQSVWDYLEGWNVRTPEQVALVHAAFLETLEEYDNREKYRHLANPLGNPKRGNMFRITLNRKNDFRPPRGYSKGSVSDIDKWNADASSTVRTFGEIVKRYYPEIKLAGLGRRGATEKVRLLYANIRRARVFLGHVPAMPEPPIAEGPDRHHEIQE
ncbi:hypothetical protein ACFW5D_37775 [Streptomyces sp. NPDC058770]